MARSLVQIPDALARDPVTFEEAQSLIARGAMSDAEWTTLRADEQISRNFRARQMLVLSLINGDISAYIWSPSSGWARVQRDYWLRAGDVLHNVVECAALPERYGDRGDFEKFLDAPDDLIGQTFVLWRQDLRPWLDASRPDTAANGGSDVRPTRKKPSAKELTAWVERIGNVPRAKIDKAFLAETWTHENPNVHPTITEVRDALDEVFGKRSRGRERKSNQIR